ncbi:MAG: hypothetical protein PeribacterA2_0974 [Candidatus Peribacter riflensis]|uniref:Uncharacterized protein n=1 Tax=Candidatus Peribacter riflensis TaxID=1735162 RepID=A0A0S1SJA5_9BACT|nr:MAG: hypothetical protein PeribacterA2_0974 [Candidatus Peribacter riflensis]ALM11436.1 MAG: hypothetical protein PeribacterB2_0976 [Candidatus Peribacter riflensis]ALM12538.1 MAG: hypothetical protein PeribacterC2_0975 [Candidatus Peribacter riflensis]ALM13639.1 MAG: hypothetical protein PeribacterD1_0974 [Candidatus Peribacter riflensis]ALM14742.1 MAG: hypothetical protein PeribacterD2_0976 [Candidatus Peribacter riflensis]
MREQGPANQVVLCMCTTASGKGHFYSHPLLSIDGAGEIMTDEIKYLFDVWHTEFDYCPSVRSHSPNAILAIEYVGP